MGEIILGVVSLACLYVVWSLHTAYVRSTKELFTQYLKQAEAAQVTMQATTLGEIASYKQQEARQALELEELRAAYQDEARARLEATQRAQDVVNEINGKVTVQGVGDAAKKANMSLSEFYQRFEEVI
jgi:hypothetical protein